MENLSFLHELNTWLTVESQQGGKKRLGEALSLSYPRAKVARMGRCEYRRRKRDSKARRCHGRRC